MSKSDVLRVLGGVYNDGMCNGIVRNQGCEYFEFEDLDHEELLRDLALALLGVECECATEDETAVLEGGERR